MRSWKSVFDLVTLVPVVTALGLFANGCSADENSSQSGGSGGSTTVPAGGGGSGQGGNVGQGGGLGGDLGLGGNQGTGGIEACVATNAEATLEKKPVDIMFIIDNSGSMSDNIAAVQDNINVNFAAIIGASGIDYRVIMISQHGLVSGQDICVGAPLSTTDCNPVPSEPGQNPPIFYHYSVSTSSHNGLCQALNSYDGGLADQFGYGPGGWKQWLRTEAFKVFVEVTDDGVTCSLDGVSYDDNDNAADGMTTAQKFDTTLLALDPEQFGTPDARNYVFHSIIGLKEKDPPTAAYEPMDPIVTAVCSTAVAGGTGYQGLSQITGGLRFPICEFASFDVVFQAIAEGVIAGSKVECEFPVPDPPEGETIDLTTVVVEYTPSSGGAVVKMTQVPTAAECKEDAFYIESNTIKLCADSCALVQADDKAKVNVLYGCKTDIN